MKMKYSWSFVAAQIETKIGHYVLNKPERHILYNFTPYTTKKVDLPKILLHVDHQELANQA